MFEVSELTGGYTSRVSVFHDLSFSVEPGHALGVIGRNGAGKTCLAETLMGLLHQHSGSVMLEGKSLSNMTPARRVRHRLALVAEGRQIFPQLTVRENLEMAAYGANLRLTAARLSRVHEIFPLLAQKSNVPAATMSGGEQQWLALGRALIQEPTAIVLDEPSLGLSPVAVESLAASLAIIRDQGMAVLLMEQNPFLLEQLCEAVLLLDKGTVTERLDLSIPEDAARVERAYLGA